MKKSTSLKLCVFAFISAIICIIGNSILEMEILTAIIHGLVFLSYLFLTISISQVIYENAKFAINLIILFMSFSMALYCIAAFSVTPFIFLVEYYVLLFYCFVLLCLASAIVLVGRLIFYSPNHKEAIPSSAEELHTNESESNEGAEWTCVCGKTNNGKFCSECGKPNGVAEITETSDISE